MAFKLATAIRNSRMTDIITAIDAGPSAGKINIYSGTRPATGGTATTLIASLTLSDPSFPAPVNGVATANAITADSSAAASGTMTWARITTSVGAFVMDCDVGLTASGADIKFPSVAVSSGQTVSISSFVLTDSN